MKLYKEHGVNPFAGCLPMLLQMPLFIVLYRLILNLSAQPPKHIPTSSRLYQDLVESGGKLQSFGMDLAESASKVSGFATLFPYLVLIGLVVATGLYQQRQMTSRTPAAAMNAQMQMIGKVIPVFLGFISFNVPAGVVLYFLVSNLFQIGQQAYLFRKKDEAPAPAGKKAIDTKVVPGDDDPVTEPTGGLSGFLNKLMKAPADAEPSTNGERDTARSPDVDDGATKPTPKGQPGAKKAQAGKRPAPTAAKAPPPPAKANKPNTKPKPKASPAAPAAPATGGFLSRLFGGGGAKPANSGGAKPQASRPAKGASNGKAGSSGTSRTSGRAQPKGQTGSKSKSRNRPKGR
jgi:YidC/Oxa1 family membrane protein insertase